MTLVISIYTDDAFYMISDTMLSVEAKNSSPNDAISYPTNPSEISTGPRTVAGLTQKVVTIRQDLFVGWSGDCTTTRRFIDFIKICLQNANLNENFIRSAQADYFKLHCGDLTKISTLIVHEHDEGIAFFPQGDFHIGSVPLFGTIYVVGSGAKYFGKYLVERAPQRFGAKSGQPSDVDIIYFMMEFVIGTVRTQQLASTGVGEGWGGWFEIILKKGHDKLGKLDRIMYASMFWEEKDGDINTFRIGRRFFQYYENNNLLVFSQSRGDKLRLHLIPPPNHGLLPQNIYMQQQKPQLLCLELINRETTERRLVMAYNELGHNFCGFAQDSRDGSAMIAFEPHKLAEIIREVYKPNEL